MARSLPLEELRREFSEHLQQDEPLARYTSARIGGPADILLTATSAGQLAEMVKTLWRLDTPFTILGGGANMLVSDLGLRGVAVLNRARTVEFDIQANRASVWAESGANFGVIARQAAQKGLTGLEWAAGIPGTLGGALYGNAGAHGSEIAQHLKLAEVLQHTGQTEEWKAGDFGFVYRSSALKTDPGKAVILSATLALEPGDPQAIQQTMDEYRAYRQRTQPPGASMGSMFKNPPGDYAGRLIEAAGLKGERIGDAQISDLHANFFINHGGASASDIYALIDSARRMVQQEFDIDLELEIQLLGDWTKANNE